MADLRITALTKAFGGAPILRGVELFAPSGSLVAILGASGSGKTTLMRLLSGFERADSGSIEIDGREVSGKSVHVPPEQRRVGYVAQEGLLFPHLTVCENVVFGLSRPDRRDRARAEALLESVGLPASYSRRTPQELSGGEMQRVALARALAPAPKLVLLDEPFAALDAALRLETRQAVVAALAAAGATALLVTHDQSEALSMGDEVAVLRDGVLAQVAPPKELYQRPIDASLAQFVGEAVLLRGTASAGFADCPLGRLRLARPGAEGPVEVMVRPEQIRFEPVARAGAVKAKVLTATFFGPDANVEMALEAGAMQIRARIAGHVAAEPGSEAWLTVEGPVMAYPASPPVAFSLPPASAEPPANAQRAFSATVGQK